MFKKYYFLRRPTLSTPGMLKKEATYAEVKKSRRNMLLRPPDLLLLGYRRRTGLPECSIRLMGVFTAYSSPNPRRYIYIYVIYTQICLEHQAPTVISIQRWRKERARESERENRRRDRESDSWVTLMTTSRFSNDTFPSSHLSLPSLSLYLSLFLWWSLLAL